ncbi:potassium transporter 10-like [Tripterygium wilfordii]|uniref:Potassium transporter n=1 Tax=Tripterygium wilfordii TaxID=458696 RepID=A0A7J7C502_TRIWF|nr:potassium transporter 10-like isoform X2 [Tripterygium wilfordii]KAF5729213.1 potassium transporter 10-like [Tripterygium wilfordii]
MTSRVESDEDTEVAGRIWALDRKFDPPLDAEAKKLKNMHLEKKVSAFLLLRLAFQSLGVVFGDLGTSPLYVFYNTFPDGIGEAEDVIGALSLIIYSLTLIPLLKYVLIVCTATDNGQGGTFALYSLLCRHADIRTIPNQDHTDEQLTTYSHATFHEQSFAAKTKKWLEGHAFKRNALLVLVLAGSCMVIGDGILTPAISVLSAVGGIKLDYPKMSSDVVMLVAVLLLFGLFYIQHYGTDTFSWLFAPVVLLWFLLIGSLGVFNICKYDSSVLKAFSPLYAYRFFSRGNGWSSLGGIVLSITGTEALFADLSHFPVAAIQIAFILVVFPCLICAYTGQAAYLMKHSDRVSNVFYESIPDSIHWPVLIVAVAAAIVASQATITATFSLIKQALALGCFPRVKVVHTSKKFLNQIYIPDINWILMILCIAVTAGFKNQIDIGNASGTAVIIVMLLTTFLMVLIMLLVWRWHWVIVWLFTTLSLIVEGTYFSSVILKVNQGGWVPLVIAAGFFIVMSSWHYGTVKRYEYEMHSKVSLAWILGLGPSLGLVRVPGIGLVYSELANGVPHIFSHFITNLPAMHSVVVFVCVKYLPVYTVPEGERFLIRRIGPPNFCMFRCVARYGYKDLHLKDEDFERNLIDSLFMFARLENMMDGCSDYSSSDRQSEQSGGEPLGFMNNEPSRNMDIDSIEQVNSPPLANHAPADIDELEFLKNCRDAGVVHMLGNTVVMARKDSRFYKKLAIDYLYAFLRKICRQNTAIFNVPHESLLNVGQIIRV